MCHLYVRSLPVDVDTKFDKSLRNFVSIPPSERDQMLQVSFQFAFDQGWSSIKRIVIRAILGILFRWFFGKSTSFFKKGVRERLSCPRELCSFRIILHISFLISSAVLNNITVHSCPSSSFCKDSSFSAASAF